MTPKITKSVLAAVRRIKSYPTMTIAIYNEQLLSYFLFNTKLFTPHPLWGT